MAETNNTTPSRRALLTSTAVATAAAAVPMGAPAFPSPAADPDAELLRLAAELRAAEENWRLAALRADNSADAGAEDGANAACVALKGLLGRMAAIPAQGPSGIAAKAGRLTQSLSDTCSIMYAERPLAASLAADLARLAPRAMAPSPASVRPDPDAELLALRVMDSENGGCGAPDGNEGLAWSAGRDMLALAGAAA